MLGVSEGTHEGTQVDTASFHGLADNSLLAVEASKRRASQRVEGSPVSHPRC